MRNIMQTWYECFVWTTESRPMSITRNVQSTNRRAVFSRTQRVFATMSVHCFYYLSLWTREVFSHWSPIAAETTIANHRRNNDRHCNNDRQLLPIWTIRTWEGEREFTPTIHLQKKFASCPKLKIWETIFKLFFFQNFSKYYFSNFKFGTEGELFVDGDCCCKLSSIPAQVFMVRSVFFISLFSMIRLLFQRQSSIIHYFGDQRSLFRG